MAQRRLDEWRARASAAVSFRLRTLGGGRWASHCRPTQVLILLTERCNARCVHCDIWKNRGKEDVPTVAEWQRTLSELRDWLGPVHVVFTGGEALLQKWAPEVVSHACRIGLLVEHLTHGYWHDHGRVREVAMADPWRITISCDGIGAVHDTVRGREHFFEAAEATIAELNRLRRAHGLHYAIRLKTTIMSHNLEETARVAAYAREHGLEVFYQPIEQNYNTAEDRTWYLHSPTWPQDPERAVAAVERLRSLKREGYPIMNSDEQLRVMIPYFRDPDAWRVATQGHQAHDAPMCNALASLQLQANGDITLCHSRPPVGNIRRQSIRAVWEAREPWWETGCCLSERMSEAEQATAGIAIAPSDRTRHVGSAG
ncbi:MAG: radical SAM protein [Gemmatimonadetes bacterium]|nr:radical SAM protein [Gemmatimonadota bacterium]